MNKYTLKRYFKKNSKRIIVSLAILLFIVLPVYFTFFSGSHVLIKDYEGRYYNARVIYMNQNFLICLKESKTYKKRSAAINSKPSFVPSFVSLRDIVLIEIVFTEEEEEFDDDYDGVVPRNYLGKYRIHLSGHVGNLYISQKNGRLYASARFPKWAKGVYERLKYVRIRKNRIYFTRSVQTIKEMRRVGASNYFVQKFRGKFTENGAMIIGKFTNRGAEQSFEAYKIK
jgi:hypothetical protein